MQIHKYLYQWDTKKTNTKEKYNHSNARNTSTNRNVKTQMGKYVYKNAITKLTLFTFIINSVKNVGSQNIQIWPSLRQVGNEAILMDFQILKITLSNKIHWKQWNINTKSYSYWLLNDSVKCFKQITGETPEVRSDKRLNLIDIWHFWFDTWHLALDIWQFIFVWITFIPEIHPLEIQMRLHYNIMQSSWLQMIANSWKKWPEELRRYAPTKV